MTTTQITNAQLTNATVGLVPPNGFIAKAMAERTGPAAPPIVPVCKPTVRAVQSSTAAEVESTNVSSGPLLILAGIDAKGKAHASTFVETDVVAAKAAAELCGWCVIEVNSEHLIELAAQLPVGKIYDSGMAHVPFVKAKLFQSLSDHMPADAQKPRDFSLPKGMTVAHKNIINKAEPASDRSKPKEGSMYLAYQDECWYEAVIVEVNGDDTVTLRWRDYDEEAPFTMRVEQLGLLPQELPVVE